MALLSHVLGEQPTIATRTRNTELQLELSRGFDLYRRFDGGTQGRLFSRFARARGCAPADGCGQSSAGCEAHMDAARRRFPSVVLMRLLPSAVSSGMARALLVLLPVQRAHHCRRRFASTRRA
jgi:hypothetical protein